MQCSIAGRALVSKSVSAAVAEVGCAEACLTLLGNDRADIASLSFRRMAERFGAMPKLRWAQAMMAGVEAWMALPDLPPGLLLTCARGTHEESMPENIIGALLYVAKPYAAAAENQKGARWVRMVPEQHEGEC